MGLVSERSLAPSPMNGRSRRRARNGPETRGSAFTETSPSSDWTRPPPGRDDVRTFDHGGTTRAVGNAAWVLPRRDRPSTSCQKDLLHLEGEKCEQRRHMGRGMAWVCHGMPHAWHMPACLVVFRLDRVVVVLYCFGISAQSILQGNLHSLVEEVSCMPKFLFNSSGQNETYSPLRTTSVRCPLHHLPLCLPCAPFSAPGLVVSRFTSSENWHGFPKLKDCQERTLLSVHGARAGHKTQR